MIARTAAALMLATLAACVIVEPTVPRYSGPVVAPADGPAQIDSYFRETLKDPDSAKQYTISEPFDCRTGDASRATCICAEINASNSYGGYTGAQLFRAIFDEGGHLSSVSESEFHGNDLFPQTCPKGIELIARSTDGVHAPHLP